MSDTEVRIGMLGCGTVGTALAQLIVDESRDIEARTGHVLRIGRIAVRDTTKDRGPLFDPSCFTADPASIVNDPDIDVVVEVMGGIHPTKDLILDALKAGKPVITANKELLADEGPDVFAAAEAAGVDLLFEAAVAGGIPLVRPMRESLLGERIEAIMGIVNGTTNYILTRMSEAGASYAAALAEAQALGFAEADPTADVEGLDAAAKIAILASIAFGVQVTADDVYHEGITGITADDMAYAARKGFVVKLVAVAERVDDDDDAIAVRVHPVLLPTTHPLASVRESFNAVFVQGRAVGDLMFYGRGAGGNPTASAVLGDLIDAASNRRKGSSASLGVLGKATIRPIDDLRAAYFVSLDVVDQPGVLAAVAGAFGGHGVSISSMEQEGRGTGARLMFVTHVARERDLRATLSELESLDAVALIGSVIRVLGGEADEDRGETRAGSR